MAIRAAGRFRKTDKALLQALDLVSSSDHTLLPMG